MAKPNRMSEIFTSSDKPADTAPATATPPPYSSEGPTLPVIEAPKPQPQIAENTAEAGNRRKKQKTDSPPKSPTHRGPPHRPPHTLHPALYTPWTLLPSELLTLLASQARLRTSADANIVPVVFSKNQNVKAGINKLKTLLGAYRDARAGIEIPDVLKDEDALIAVSAQGEGAGKLVGIVELVRRVVAPGEGEGSGVEKWWVYTVLSSVEMEWKGRRDTRDGKGGKMAGEDKGDGDEDEEEAFERMDVDTKQEQEEKKKVRKVPVLTVWLTRKRIPAFGKEFGEQSVLVEKMKDED